MAESIAPSFAVLDRADWRAAPRRAVRLHPLHVTGRYQHARRCIDPPALDLTPVASAAAYELLVTPASEPDAVYSLRSKLAQVDLAPVWPRLPFGSLQLTARAWDDAGQLIGTSPITSLIRSPDWDGRQCAPLDYRAAGHGVIDYLIHRVPAAPAHPDMPAYMWHATEAGIHHAPETDLQYPALSYPSLIGLFVRGAADADTDGSAAELLTRARQLVDFLIDHPVVASGPLAGAPRSTMSQEGMGAHREEDRITLVRLGWVGCAVLDLADVTGDARYADYAEHLGRILVETQLPDGSWPYRVRLSDGVVVELYTAAAVIALLLLERLQARSSAGPYTSALERGLAWTIANPVRTGLWQHMYEDAPSSEPYDNLEQWGALETAMLLLRRRHPDAITLARNLVRYVEDQFVVFGDDPVFPTSYLPFTPCVLEQYWCYWPMDCHTATYTRATLALYEATGEIDWAHKAIAAANTIVSCQGPDGRLSTLVPDRRLGGTPSFPDWFNCMADGADLLLRFGPTLTAIAKEVGYDVSGVERTTAVPLGIKGAQG